MNENPFEAPVHDEVYDAQENTFVIYRGADCLYLENAIELPHHCIKCGRRARISHRYIKHNVIGMQSFKMKYVLCWVHALIAAVRGIVKFICYVVFIILLLSTLINFDAALFLFCLGSLIILLAIEKSALRARQHESDEAHIWRVTGFGEDFLSQFKMRTEDTD